MARIAVSHGITDSEPGKHRIETMVGVENEVQRIVSSPVSFPSLPKKLLRAERRMNLQSFLQAFFDFFFKGGHFRARFQAHEMDFARSHAQSRARNVHQFLHRHVAFR